MGEGMEKGVIWEPVQYTPAELNDGVASISVCQYRIAAVPYVKFTLKGVAYKDIDSSARKKAANVYFSEKCT